MKGLYFQWHITDACNFRCRHCYQDRFDSSLELDGKGLRSVSDRIIRAAAEHGAKAVVNVTGGEPFLKKELFELLAYLDSHNEVGQLIIITNASMVSRSVIKKIKEIKKINQIKVSLEGAGPDSNDAIRGAGSFNKVMQAMGLLKESGFSVTVMFTAMKSNLGEGRGLFGLCQELGIDGLIIERFFPMGEGARIRAELLDSRDWFNLVKAFLELTGESCTEQDILSQRAFWVRFLKTKAELLGASCNVGRDSFCIMPNADVFPCRRFNLKIGNLLEMPLGEIMNSPLLTDIITARRKGKCACCYLRDCRGCPALSYLLTGDYLSDDFQCWYGSPELQDAIENFS